jgi:hypothetical protein
MPVRWSGLAREGAPMEVVSRANPLLAKRAKSDNVGLLIPEPLDERNQA